MAYAVHLHGREWFTLDTWSASSDLLVAVQRAALEWVVNTPWGAVVCIPPLLHLNENGFLNVHVWRYVALEFLLNRAASPSPSLGVVRRSPRR